MLDCDAEPRARDGANFLATRGNWLEPWQRVDARLPITALYGAVPDAGAGTVEKGS